MAWYSVESSSNQSIKWWIFEIEESDDESSQTQGKYNNSGDENFGSDF